MGQWEFWRCACSVSPQPDVAQKPAAPGSPERTRQILIANAHALESRGRPDMAIQIWQQILLSDPKNAEALAGLARDYKLSGNLSQSDAALERLRSVNPNDPNIAKIQALASTKAQSDRLRQAGNLARQGNNEDAMRIYRELYGDRPPDGDIALAYYQTLYGTAERQERLRSKPCARLPRAIPATPVLRSHWADADLRSQDPRRGHSHPEGASPGPERADGAAPGAHLGFGQSRFRCGIARVSQAASAGHGAREPPEGKRNQAGADELRHRAHSGRTGRFCGVECAQAGRRAGAIHWNCSRRSRPTAASRQAWAFCACSRTTLPGPSAI